MDEDHEAFDNLKMCKISHDAVHGRSQLEGFRGRKRKKKSALLSMEEAAITAGKLVVTTLITLLSTNNNMNTNIPIAVGS